MARYLIDANLPRWLSLWSGGDCEFVHDLGASWSDSQIWAYADRHALTIVSKDADFSDRVLLCGGGSEGHPRPCRQSHDRRAASVPLDSLARCLPCQ